MNNTSSTPKQTWKQRLLKGSGWTFLSVFVWELMEEGLENLIAFAITSAVVAFATKALAVVFTTQLIKVSLKKIGKWLMPIIKSITYKEGNDKMQKVKNFFALIGSKTKSFFTWIFSNKKTLSGIASGVVMTLSSTGVIDVNALPELPVNGFNVTPIIYYSALLVVALIGVCGKGFESVKDFFARVTAKKEAKAIAKEVKKVNKVAQAEYKAEKKLDSQKQVDNEKAKAKAEAKEKARLEKEQADAAFRQKVDAVKAQIKAETNANK